MTIEEKEKYLLKTAYSAKDIMYLLGIGHTQATKIMKEIAIKYQGAIPNRTNVVKASSFWVREGTTREEELRVIAYAKGYCKEELHERNI